LITLLTLSSVSAQFRKTAHQPRHREDLSAEAAGFIGVLMRFDSAGIFAASGLKFHQMPALFSVIRLLFMALGELWFAERVRPSFGAWVAAVCHSGAGADLGAQDDLCTRTGEAIGDRFPFPSVVDMQWTLDFSNG